MYKRLKEHGDDTRTIPKDWFEAFSRLDQVLARKDTVLSPHNKKIVFLDEFPWFATARSDFLMAFGEFWNRRGTESGDYLFIICGSATSWIIKNVLDNTGSLYHRVTCQLFLAPFTLRETELFLNDRGFEWARSQILELLSHHRYGLMRSECQMSLKLADGTFSRAVEDLVKCGYIMEYKRNYEKRNPSYLQLIDPFLLFHYHFLSKDSITASYTELAHMEGSFSNWRGSAFEITCLQHIDQIKSGLGISGVRTRGFPWAGKCEESGAQIDLVIERDDRITDLCEMKCTDKPFVITGEYETNLLHKKEVFRKVTGTKQTLHIVLVSAEGIAGTAHTEHLSAVALTVGLSRPVTSGASPLQRPAADSASPPQDIFLRRSRLSA